MDTDIRIFQTKVTWLPADSTFQLSFNKKFARMRLELYKGDKKLVNIETLRDWRLVPYIRDEKYQYFATKKYKEEAISEE